VCFLVKAWLRDGGPLHTQLDADVQALAERQSGQQQIIHLVLVKNIYINGILIAHFRTMTVAILELHLQ